MIKTIPLSRLITSPRNVRRSSNEQADLQLKADIEARGLLQNLVVAPARKPRGSFAVEAGGRRLRALKALVGESKLEASHEVPCLVIGGGAIAQEASLAENFHRLAMNPTDECLAFGQLIEQGADVEGVARRFGLTVRFVEGRLRLAALAPVVFEALGAGEITLDVAKAYGATPDRERQAFVFEQVSRSYMTQHPESIRRMMTQATVSASDPRARFVGEEAYVAAGGRIERDLFSDEDGTRWLDIALVERLATEKLEALANEKATELGLAWVRPTLESWIGYPATAGLQRVVPEREPLTEEEVERIEVAHAEIEALIAVIEDEETADEVRQEAEEKAKALEREIAVLRDKPAIVDETLRPQLGAFLLLEETGAPVLDSVFYSEAEEREDEEPGDDRGGDRTDSPVTAGEPELKERPQTISRALLDELAIQRRDVLAVHVAADPALALDLAIFLMVDRDAGYSSGKSGSSLVALPPTDPVFGFKTPDAAATVARAQAVGALDRSWTEGNTRGERFNAFRALSDEARAGWLSHAVARTLEASANASERACPFHDHIGALLGIEVAKWWRPTGPNYFDRAPKAVTLAALEEVGGPAFASRYSGLKKAELSQSAERIFAGDFIAEVEVKERARAWVPEAMRFAESIAPSAPANEETPPWEEEEAKAPSAPEAADPAPESAGGEPEAGGEEPSESFEEAA